jgi:hypothetical protein
MRPDGGRPHALTGPARSQHGEAERNRFAAEQRAAFLDVTAAWSPEERIQFARLLTRYGADATAWSRKRATSRDWTSGAGRRRAGGRRRARAEETNGRMKG